ncbi:hypothetical protein M2475_001969 [Breznakia sp. PF5-3]|uniref:hypothetical protein n=1 Tax=unclassified Breznakia TaxID=2623764 RepID=UPI002406707F|nr:MULTISPECIES: hypothetical protein [unclassified Breznakia]MDF9825522.1 hypothetical protein [Breznakia sp. PM6-1]MDF9836389.1 hypothetical protein [Breznakia sp. PF5-3]MDF9838733.1 hypothetical protein [Breznakia sp. PFB2-8]MDF9860541.1 hypothetical protein [Breznakia sp. PH5-24]
MKKKALLVSILIVSVIILSVSLVNFVTDKKSEINIDKMTDYEEKQIERFYNKSPELISSGEIFDIKYVFYNQYDQSLSNFEIVIKGTTYYKIDKIIISFCENNKNECKKVSLEKENIELFNLKNGKPVKYNNIGLMDFDESWKYAKKEQYDLSKVEIEIFYNNKSEKFDLVAIKESLIKLYEPKSKLEEAIKKYKFDDYESIFFSELNQWVQYIRNIYYYDLEMYRDKLSVFTKTLNESKKGNEILKEETRILNAYIPNVRTDESSINDYETSKFIYEQLKQLYNKDGLDISSSVKTEVLYAIYNVNKEIKFYSEKELYEISEDGKEINDIKISEYFSK